MAGWDIPPAVRSMMESRLRDDLASEPAKHIKRALAPWGERLNIFSPIVVSLHPPQDTYIFTFHLVYGEDEESLIVMQSGYAKVSK